MSQNTQLTSPTVRIHRASPSTPLRRSPMIAQQSPFQGGGWPTMGANFLSALPQNFQDPRYHKRASSGGSSIHSTGPESPLDQTVYNPRIATSEANYSPSRFEFDYSPQTAKTTHSMPDTMMYPGNYAPMDMRRIHSSNHDDRASYGPQSVSSMSHVNSPATPQTWEDSYDPGFQSAAYQQSLQDVFPEQIQYNVPKMGNHRHTLQEQFSKSQQQHLQTGSPTSNPREKSPFKPGSIHVRPTPQPQRRVPALKTQRTSVSPKELMLGENEIEDNQPSLFGNDMQYTRLPSSSQMSNFNFAPSFQQEQSIQMPQHYPFVSQSSSQNIPIDSTPDFHAPLLSMESTNEEGPSEPSSQQSMHRQIKQEPVRPADTSSDAGTYSCTYHGCPQRFDSPTKLQKHKREGHRQTETGPIASSAKNSQAGPHRCDRINPSTGKPCNSIFSRPYDLTRHEDTIHNNRKMKVRCHLCTEEKTFSRNDALTRHMRVVHPDVDWVGKQKKRASK